MMKRSTVRVAGFFAAGVIILLSTAAAAQDQVQPPSRPNLRVTGEATISANPDQAQIDIGVTTQSPTAQAAAANNATKLDAALAELRRLLGASADIKTVSYSLSPSYRYPREGGQPTITGYTATNIVQVKIDDLKQVGKVIDSVTQAGANNIHALRYTLKDDDAVRNRALGEAGKKARAKAEALASAMGLRIVKILQVDERAGPSPRAFNVAYAEARMAGAPTTPVEPGTIEIVATVVLTVEVAQ
jgi:uncharacterized protein YggE